MLYKIEEAFSLRDEIGTCPNIEVEIDVTDKSPIFIRPYHVKEEDKNFIDKEMKWVYYWGTLKEGFSAYSSPVMLISRKVTWDRRGVTDIRHLNIRIAKNNLVYPLLKDTFSALCSSRCEVLSVFSQRILKDTVEYYHILAAHHIYITECLWGLNISPSILQSYINAILECLQSRKYYKAIMDDLVLFTPSKKSHIAKLKDL